MTRHPDRDALLRGDEHALEHAETCEQCADLLLEDDEVQASVDGAPDLRSMLGAVLRPGAGFDERTQSATVERIRMQDVWDLVGDTAGGVLDALKILGERPGILGERPAAAEAPVTEGDR